MKCKIYPINEDLKNYLNKTEKGFLCGSWQHNFILSKVHSTKTDKEKCRLYLILILLDKIITISVNNRKMFQFFGCGIMAVNLYLFTF